MAYSRPVGARWKIEVRVTMRGGNVVKENQMFDSKAAADMWGEEREKELRAMRDGGLPSKTVGQLIERWRTEIAPGRDGAKWDITRLLAIERRFAEMGFLNMQLRDFGPRQMAQVRERRMKEISPPSVKREESLLMGVWAKGRHPSWAWTDVDPFKDLGPIKGSKGKPRTRKAAWPELKRILRQLGYHPRRPETTKTAEVGLAMLVALRTTLRSQEVLQLGDGHVDIEQLVARIEQHKTRYITNEAKVVPIMPKALVLLSRKCLGKERYFTVAPASRDTLYRKARNLAGIPDLKFHDLKRTSVLALKDMLDDGDIIAVTGNRDVDVLRRHYMTETAAEAAKVIWRALGANRQVAVDRAIAKRAASGVA